MDVRWLMVVITEGLSQPRRRQRTYMDMGPVNVVISPALPAGSGAEQNVFWTFYTQNSCDCYEIGQKSAMSLDSVCVFVRSFIIRYSSRGSPTVPLYWRPWQTCRSILRRLRGMMAGATIDHLARCYVGCYARPVRFLLVDFDLRSRNEQATRFTSLWFPVSISDVINGCSSDLDVRTSSESRNLQWRALAQRALDNRFVPCTFSLKFDNKLYHAI